MILRGSIRGNGSQLADYLLKKGENESVQVFDIRGTSQPDSLKKSLIEMSLSVELSGRTKKGLYHVVINPRRGEDRMMTTEQWHRAAEIIEQERGFTGQKRVMVMHEKDGRLHMHVAWERYNHQTGKIICNEYSHQDEKRARWMMELEFGHELTDEKNKERPALKLLLSNLWALHTSGQEFQKAVEKAGYTIAKQEGRRPFVVINAKGRSFELVKEIPKVRVRQVRERLKGTQLPDMKQVMKEIAEKQNSHRKRKTRDEIADELKQNLTRGSKRSKDRGR
jgi:hypothetical protein